MRKTGFTLVEIIVVVACMMLVITPTMRIFQFGTKSSLRGMQTVDITLEGRRIIRQIHQDLKMACMDWSAVDVDGRPVMSFSLADLLEIGGIPPGQTYAFWCFPFHGEVEDAVSTRKDLSLPAWRRVNRVTYRVVVKNPGDPMELIREERFHPDHPLGGQYPGRIHHQVLTKKLNYFQIDPKVVKDSSRTAKDQWFFHVTLQLRDGKPNAGSTNSESLRDKIYSAGSGIIMCDLFDVVYPEFFQTYYNFDGMMRNWYTEPECVEE